MAHHHRLFDDTPPHIAAMLIQHWRNTPPLQKLAQISSLNATLQQLALARLAQQYPEEQTEQHLRRYRERLFGYELVNRVYATSTVHHAGT